MTQYRNFRRFALSAALVSLLLTGRMNAQPAPMAADTDTARRERSEIQTFVTSHCATCHNETDKAGALYLAGRNLDQFDENLEVWEKVLQQVIFAADATTGSAAARCFQLRPNRRHVK